MKTKSFPAIVRRMSSNIGFWGISHHEPTEENPIGQTHEHLIMNDIVDVVLNSKDEREACLNLLKYFDQGEVEIK